MIVPELKSYIVSDYIDGKIDNVDDWMPEDPELVDFWFEISVGVKGTDGADNFSVHLVSQKQLSQISNKDRLLVIPYFESMKKLISQIEITISKCTDVSWPGVCEQLNSHFHWEYEDYKQ